MEASPRLSATVEAVEFGMSFHGSAIKVIVLASDLQDLFGAGARPAQWLACYETNKHAIRRAARRGCHLTGSGIFIVSRADLEAAHPNHSIQCWRSTMALQIAEARSALTAEKTPPGWRREICVELFVKASRGYPCAPLSRRR
jgi:hypothetical protein